MKREQYQKAKSWCFCGHMGDGPDSAHLGFNGHGACSMEGCDCEQFTWKGFTKYYQRLIDQEKGHKMFHDNAPQAMTGIVRALELAIDRLEVNDGEGEEQAYIGVMQEAIRACLAVEEAHLIDPDDELNQLQPTETNYV